MVNLLIFKTNKSKLLIFLFMMQLNEDEVVKLADVGLTKPERDISGTICGSTCYSAPEVKSSPELHHIIL